MGCATRVHLRAGEVTLYSPFSQRRNNFARLHRRPMVEPYEPRDSESNALEDEAEDEKNKTHRYSFKLTCTSYCRAKPVAVQKTCASPMWAIHHFGGWSMLRCTSSALNLRISGFFPGAPGCTPTGKIDFIFWKTSALWAMPCSLRIASIAVRVVGRPSSFIRGTSNEAPSGAAMQSESWCEDFSRTESIARDAAVRRTSDASGDDGSFMNSCTMWPFRERISSPSPTSMRGIGNAGGWCIAGGCCDRLPPRTTRRARRSPLDSPWQSGRSCLRFVNSLTSLEKSSELKNHYERVGSLWSSHL